MSGEIIYPLNQMKSIFPEIYEAQFKKYDWRPEIPVQRIPQLNCLWNDVVFLFATHPSVVSEALVESELNPLIHSYYEIPLDRLDMNNLSVKRWTRDNEGYHEFWEEFDISKFDFYQKLDEGTRQYFEDCKNSLAQRLLVYLTVPHILYKGTINVSGLNIIKP